MLIEKQYTGMEERRAIVQEMEGQGCVMRHDDYAPDWKRGEEIRGTLTFDDAPVFTPPPEVPAFRGAMLAKLGIRKANALARDYPTYLEALYAQNWAVAKQVMDMALSDGGITQDDYDAVAAAMAEHHIPDA